VEIFLLKILLVALLFTASCQTGMNRMSSRPLTHIEKSEGKSDVIRREIVTDPKRSNLFVKEQKLKIVPTDEVSDTGSLFNIHHQNNYLFVTHRPAELGDTLEIEIVQKQRAVQSADPDKVSPTLNQGKSESDGRESSQATSNEGGSARDKLEQELLKELPDLAPSSGERPQMLTRLAMEVTGKLPNGDITVQSRRNSVSPSESHSIKISARIPFSAVSAGEGITTDDLVDVVLVDTKRGEIITRSASGWEDEYSLRISGFDESKSLAARELQEKQRSLLVARGKLEKRMKSFAAERSDVLKMRENLQRSAKAEEGKSELGQAVPKKDSTQSGKQEETERAEKSEGEPNASAQSSPPKPADGQAIAAKRIREKE
jgi:flagellar basal body L-ring protein FlgH